MTEKQISEEDLKFVRDVLLTCKSLSKPCRTCTRAALQAFVEHRDWRRREDVVLAKLRDDVDALDTTCTHSPIGAAHQAGVGLGRSWMQRDVLKLIDAALSLNSVETREMKP